MGKTQYPTPILAKRIRKKKVLFTPGSLRQKNKFKKSTSRLSSFKPVFEEHFKKELVVAKKSVVKTFQNVNELPRMVENVNQFKTKSSRR
ncbi:hypothetical protein BLOT_002985 [Blomia tropicalis]|nr:hypothetical protein BLOT_002985 [Blomia tropicalis]